MEVLTSFVEIRLSANRVGGCKQGEGLQGVAGFGFGVSLVSGKW